MSIPAGTTNYYPQIGVAIGGSEGRAFVFPLGGQGRSVLVTAPRSAVENLLASAVAGSGNVEIPTLSGFVFPGLGLGLASRPDGSAELYRLDGSSRSALRANSVAATLAALRAVTGPAGSSSWASTAANLVLAGVDAGDINGDGATTGLLYGEFPPGSTEDALPDIGDLTAPAWAAVASAIPGAPPEVYWYQDGSPQWQGSVYPYAAPPPFVTELLKTSEDPSGFFTTASGSFWMGIEFTILPGISGLIDRLDVFWRLTAATQIEVRKSTVVGGGPPSPTSYTNIVLPSQAFNATANAWAFEDLSGGGEIPFAPEEHWLIWLLADPGYNRAILATMRNAGQVDERLATVDGTLYRFGAAPGTPTVRILNQVYPITSGRLRRIGP